MSWGDLSESWSCFLCLSYLVVSFPISPPLSFLTFIQLVSNIHHDDDNISNIETDTESRKSVANHFPLEISTDNGGVSALLPSGQVLVDRTASSTDRSQHEMSVDVAEKVNKILNSTQDEADDNLEKSQDDEIDEKRSSDTANVDSPKSDTREEPVEEMNQVQPDEGEQQQAQPNKIQEGESSSPEASLLQTHTSSSISEDPTFNSYAPSELSSMMSHLEIQHLLKMGRQQQLDMMAINNGGGPTTIPARPPVDIIERGSKKGKFKPTMTLYSNQSLYAPSNIEKGDRSSGTSPLLRATKMSPSPPPIEDTPSSSSHGLLQRTDAMDDVSVKSKFQQKLSTILNF